MEKRVFNANFLKGAVCAALAALLCATLLTCSNSAGGSDAPVSQKDSPLISSRPGYVILNGTVNASGAVPQILADTPDSSENENDLSRSARPGIDASGADATMEYFATATCDGLEPVNGVFGTGADAKKFGIELLADKTWSVVVGVRSKTPDEEGNKKIYLQSKPWSVTPDPADPTISRNFVPVPNTSGGEGKIELKIKYSPSSYTVTPKFVSGPAGVDLSKLSFDVDTSTQTVKVKNVESGKYEVPSGVYELCLDFLTPLPGNMLEYSSIQTVTVADGMTTNSWVDDANASALSPISGGEFKFNNDNKRDLTAAFLGTTVFVGKVSSDSAEPDDSNSGNFLSPLKTITRAAERINAVGKSDLDYYIRVSGEVSGSSSNSAAVIQTLDADKAKSLTIIGTSGPDADCIKSVTYQHSALNVKTPVPIKLKNIKIVGATGGGIGDAVVAWGSANVIIEDNVEITGADVGVSVSDSASVTMKGGTIAGNGVAVDMKAGSFVVQGGSIPYDSANKKNYVKTASEKFVTAKGDLAAVDASGGKIAIDPAEKKRGVKLVDTSAATASAADIEAKFMVYDPTISAENPSGDEWQVVAAAAEHALKTNAPIYVGQDPNGYAGSNDNPGTKSAPYYEIQRACEDMDDADMPYTINVRGKLPKQIIPSTLSKESTGIYKAKSVLIKGVTPIPTSGENAGIPQDKIQVGLGGTVVKSALTVASKVPITIQNLKITGGEDTNGGGLYLNSGTEVHLESGVLITDNTAKNHGGGVYCAGGKLYINEGAKICGNHVSPSSGNYGGIGLYATGDSVIEMTGGEISGNKDTSHVDVVGGGVKLEGSASFKMSGGEVKDNQVVRLGGNFYVTGGGDSGPSVTLSGSAKITGGVADSSSTSYDAIGGAIWLEGAGSRLDMSGGEISGNSAKSSDGKNACAGIYVSGATFTMTGGKISGNNVLGGNSQGGAVRLNGSFNISGSAYIPYGGAIGNNDVYLCDGKTVTIAGALNPPSGVTKVAAITPSVFKRGTDILDGTAVLLTQHKEKFSVSQDDADWQKKDKTVAGQYYVAINSPVYVVGTESSGSTKPDGFGWGQTTGATGTKGHPFASVSAALSVLEAGAIDEITIAGLLKGAQTISGTFPSFTLKGYGGSSSAVINAGGASGAGSALTVDASGKTVTIQDLAITGGNASSGGGIKLSAGTVNLESGAKVYSNKVTSGGSGAGVYVDASTTLNIKEGSEIYSNSANSGNIDGGGVYNKGSVNISGGKLYKNTANNGGAIYNAGVLAISNGTIGGSANDKNTAVLGGAIYNAASKSFTLSGGSLTYNYAASGTSEVEVKGGGVYNAGTLTISGSASISYNTASQTNTSKGYASGGGIYNASTGSVTVSDALTMYGNAATVTATTSGYSTSSGGAIYNAGILTMSNGTIGSSSYPNKALGNTVTVKQGGAIYQGGTFNVSGSAVVTAGTEKENDVYLPLGKTVTVASVTLSGGDSVAAVTPANWNRGTNIIDWGVSPSVAQKKTIKGQIQLSKDNAGWDREEKASGGKNYVCITSPIYVAGASGTGSTLPSGFNNGKTIANGANGTKTSPYASIADALTASDLDKATEPNTITVAGTLVGAQQEISSPSVDIKLKGYTSDAKIQRWSSKKTSSQDAGSVLIVNASGKTVTITDLTLSYGASSNGGGIYITNGTVKLGDYAKISENYAGNKGGGVYVSSGATLFMYGKALIGDKLSTDTGITTATGQNYGNAAPYQGGGGIYNEGSVYIGYNGFKADGTTLQESAIDAGYGIIRCYTMNQDGGAIYNNGTLKIKSGSISYNRTANSGGAVVCVADATISGGTFESNYAGVSGGAVSIKASKTLTINGDAIFKNNQAESGGGAISNWGTLTMTAGTIGESGALNRIAEGKTGSGGAISQNGTFNISGSAQVYSGTGVGEKQNDVYLASGKTVTAGVFETGGNSSSIPMVITPYSWTRGSTAVTAATGVTLDATKLKCFKMSDEDWSVVLHSSAGKINAPVYVASDTSTAGFKVCTGLGSDSDGNGSRAKPYKTIAKALSKAWDASTTKTIPLVIKIDGTVKGNQTIAGNINAQYVAINGCYSSTDFTDCVLDGNASGTVLTITTATPVCLDYKLKITNGSNADGNGGGVSISGTSSTVVVRGVRIQGNTAKNGGGLYVGPGCKAICNNYGRIGAYLENINNKAPGLSTALSTGINKATNYGGGIYNEGTLYLGYSYNYSTGVISDPWDDDPFSVDGNYATAQGGGVYTIGNMSMIEDNTSISYNGSSHAGGVCVATTGDDKAFFDSGIIESNSVAGYGGGIFITTGAKAEIKADSTRPFIVRNNSGQTGGGLNIGGNLKATGSDFYVYGNSATTVGGGGAYVNGVFDFREGVIGRDENGNVKSNTKTTGKGSGVYVASSASQFIMAKDGFVDVNNDIYLPINARIYVYHHSTRFKSDPPPGIITRPSYTTDTEIFAMGPDFGDTGFSLGVDLDNFKLSNSQYEIKLVSGTWCIKEK